MFGSLDTREENMFKLALDIIQKQLWQLVKYFYFLNCFGSCVHIFHVYLLRYICIAPIINRDTIFFFFYNFGYEEKTLYENCDC